MAATTSMPEPVVCTCSHWVNCNHECHGRHCDPTEHVCSIEFLPDEGGLAPWGCADCTPGQGLPHAEGCAIGVPLEGSAASANARRPARAVRISPAPR